MRKIRLLALLMLAFGWLNGQTKKEDVKSFTLQNGMKFLVIEDHSIPNANMYLFWKVGSRNEVPGITGLSHFFEHMMFNGAAKYGPKMFDRTMEAAGGSNNAYTTQDITVYTDWFPATSLETIFDLESDRIGSLAIDPKMVESERGVVLSERSTGLENSNFRRLMETVQSLSIEAHPYHWSVIGYESDIKAWKQEDLENYFKTYYAPNNCVVVVAGDVKLDQVQALAKKYLEPIPQRPITEEIRTVEPPQEGEKRVVVHKDVSSENLGMAWHSVQATHPDYMALDLLGYILSSGNTSRLTRNLVLEKQIATSVFAYQGMSMDPELFVIFGVATPGKDAIELEREIMEEVERIKREGVTEEELVKVQNQKVMEFYREMETINGKANTVGTYEIYFGDFALLFDAPARYKKVTTADIQRVAQTYLVNKNITVGVMKPESK